MRRLARAAAVIAALAVVAALAGAAYAAVPSSIPAAKFAQFVFHQNLGARLPLDAMLRDPHGQPRKLGNEFGRLPVVIDFEYDKCTTLCGVMLDQLSAALASLPIKAGRDYRLVAIDIDPATTTAAARAFAREHGADKPGMIVLTGTAPAIRRVADAAGFPYHRDAATGQYAHPAGFVIATPQGRISRYLLGLNWQPIDLRLALSEAAGSQIAGPAEQILLFCYCYDPATGRYDVAIARLLKMVGVATLLALGALVWIAVRMLR